MPPLLEESRVSPGVPWLEEESKEEDGSLAPLSTEAGRLPSTSTAFRTRSPPLPMDGL